MARLAPLAPRGASALVALAAAACSAVAGCSDPVPPPAQGAASFEMGGSGCNVRSAREDLKLGAVDAQRATPLVDRETGTIFCRVAPKGGGFDVSLSIASGGDSFNLSGLVVPDTSTEVLVSLKTSGTVTDYQSAPPGGCAETDCGQPCRVSFPASPDPAAPTFGVRAGRLWAAFECPTLTDARNTEQTGTCSVPSFSGQPGYVVVENCDEE
jgi:hypothetical protein